MGARQGGRVVAVVGATATGKTALAVALARSIDGEIINADSRQVYRGMDIGTAKPTAEEQAAAKHWCVDIIDPDEPFSLAIWVDLARAALEDIRARGKTPIVAGGSGQYVWALLEGWSVPRVAPDQELRASLQERARHDGVAALYAMLQQIDPDSAAAIDRNNPRRIIRALEVTQLTGRPFSEWRRREPPDFELTVIGLRMERAALHRRIDARVDAMIRAGLIDEVRSLRARGHGCGLPSMSGIGYRQVCRLLDGEMTEEAAVAEIKTETHRLARMQNTWFTPTDPRIRWLDATSPSLVEDALAIVRP